MYKLVLFILPFLGAGNRQGHRFEIKFYNVKDSCIRTINESGIEKVDWANQQYTLKVSEDFSNIVIFDGRVSLNFDGKMLLPLAIYDFSSAIFAPKNTPFTYANLGHIHLPKRVFSIVCYGECPDLDSVKANRGIRDYLKQQHVKVK